ncbi:MAG TPA: prolyl aminopeptidase [Candidatus Aquilonibacter sp.]|nr:prolyl aminopeptidase [Candidatus Aquilonibacter sp.]
MDKLYPNTEPYAHGLLDVDEGHSIYWESCGNPIGIPALYVHGGPGAGCTAGARRYFDPRKYRAILFDQRGCGRSLPLLTNRHQLTANTTQELIRDMERLREHLSIEKWLLLGSSWGTTLSLAYAQTHPERVLGLVLACVTTTSRREVDWITNGIGRVFPSEFERFVSHIPGQWKDAHIVDAYAELLFDKDPSTCAAAAREWCAWEDAHVSLTPGHTPSRRFKDPAFRLRFARLVTHYWRYAAFLEDEQLMRNAPMLNGINGVLIHGRYDVSSPLETAWQLHNAWNSSALQIVDNSGHGGDGIATRIVEALQQFC